MSCLLLASPAAAQWRAELQAGRLRYDAAPVSTTSLAGSLSRATPESLVGVSLGAPFSREEPVWAALRGVRRIGTSGDVAFGVDLGADAFAYHLSAADTSVLGDLFDAGDASVASVTGWGATAEIMPFVVWRGAPFRVEARAGFVAFTSDGEQVEARRRGAFVADAYVETAAWHAFTVRAEGRWVDVAEGDFPYAGATLVWEGPFAAWGSVGRWFDPDVESLSWRAGVAVPVGDRLALLLNGEHEEIEPVYDTPARTTWGAGVRILLGRLTNVREPLPDAYADGVATIRLDDAGVDDERAPSIAGDFNDWVPAPMTRDARGQGWTFRTPLAPGVYHYAFVDADGNWFVPEGTPGRRADGMGGYVAVLVVEET